MMRDPLAMRFAQIVHDEICGCGEPHRSHGDTYLTIGRALRREVGGQQRALQAVATP